MKATKQMKCCVCKIEIDNGMDFHNPAPIGKYTSDVCCTYCNITKVLPVRIEQTRKEQKIKWKNLGKSYKN